MHPILFRIPIPNWNIPGIGLLHEKFVNGTVSIYSYGVMLGLSLVVGWYLTLYLAEKDGLPKETMANCYVVTAIASIIGSRLLYVVTNLNEFDSLGDFFALRRGGLVAYGGFLGGYFGAWGYLKLKQIPLMPWADAAVPSLASGLGITRIGCYLFGCDFGKPLAEGSPGWLQKAGTFPHWAPGTIDRGDGAPAWIQHVNAQLITPDAAHSLPVHPTQLYESLVGWVLLALLLLQRKHQKFRGQVFMLFVFGYGFVRFLLELVRDDVERGAYGPALGAHILIPVALLVFAAAYAAGFAQAVPNVQMRRLTQILAFIPAIAAFLAMRPESFGTERIIQLSTSQWVGVLTSAAVGIAFMVFWKAAQAHPAEAMSLHLERFHAMEAEAERMRRIESAAGAGQRAEEEERDAAEPELAEKQKASTASGNDIVEVKLDDDDAARPKRTDDGNDTGQGPAGDERGREAAKDRPNE
ncbi:MAG: prolipoprotein diacylglyceryl transferase [Polyangiaceae bacterium]|nr:prolipoprotein diacylglyceryl transferase [Polyangiaceae bacterium]